jgi:hypothetical protein
MDQGRLIQTAWKALIESVLGFRPAGIAAILLILASNRNSDHQRNSGGYRAPVVLSILRSCPWQSFLSKVRQLVKKRRDLDLVGNLDNHRTSERQRALFCNEPEDLRFGNTEEDRK